MGRILRPDQGFIGGGFGGRGRLPIPPIRQTPSINTVHVTAACPLCGLRYRHDVAVDPSTRLPTGQVVTLCDPKQEAEWRLSADSHIFRWRPLGQPLAPDEETALATEDAWLDRIWREGRTRTRALPQEEGEGAQDAPRPTQGTEGVDGSTGEGIVAP
jgi:hypothetical protein